MDSWTPTRVVLRHMHSPIDTVLPADSVEFCPHPDASNVFVCGTYKLQEEQNLPSSGSISPSSGPASACQNQIRTGQCLVFEVDSEEEISACASSIIHGVVEFKGLLAPKSRRFLSLQFWILNGERNFISSGRNGEIEQATRTSGVTRRRADSH